MSVTATVVWASGKGYWFAEVDSTHESVFIHVRNVKGRRMLRLDDRVRLDIAPNPRIPGETHGVNVEYMGHCVVRQTGEPLVQP